MKQLISSIILIFIAITVNASGSQCSDAVLTSENRSLNDLLRPLKENSDMNFFEHIVRDDPTSFGNALAMNIQYKPILEVRKIIENKIGRPLGFFKGWDPNGEAHVTTITPPEFVFQLREYISMERIHEIAKEIDIQRSDLKILGIGSGKKMLDGKEEETFFVIVDSYRLREIRHRVYEEFISNGGGPGRFDPTSFYPHITIGYTRRDLHESDGVLKNLSHSLDHRFGTVNLLDLR